MILLYAKINVSVVNYLEVLHNRLLPDPYLLAVFITISLLV
jgi:hypothetical protein